MKKIFYIVTVLLAIVCGGLTSCDDDYEKYSDMRDREISALSRFIENPTLGEIKGKKISVISEDEFLKDTITDLSKNEFVRFSNGVYMQIVRRGCGSILRNGECATLLCRFKEYNINGDSLVLDNITSEYYRAYDKIDVKNTSGTFQKSFCMREDNTTCQSAMYNFYYEYCASLGLRPIVPEGWLVPLSYIKLGRPKNAGEEIAKVRLIVPHDQGHLYASDKVCAMYYEITYERGI